MRTANGAFWIALVGLGALASARGDVQTYTIEDVNDPDNEKYPIPAPVNAQTYSFLVTEKGHTENIRVDSTHLRNLASTIENLGEGRIEKPYLYGPQGWDFRSCETLAKQITEGAADNFEKFVRVDE